MLLATLFFMWGFISVINGTLLPHLRSVFELSYFETGLIESVWFIGYLLASLPAAKLIERIGYQRALTTGLTVMTVGSLGMILAGARGLVVEHEAFRRGEERWFSDNIATDFSLYRQDVGFIGFGSIGRECARLLAPFQPAIRAPSTLAAESSMKSVWAGVRPKSLACFS